MDLREAPLNLNSIITQDASIAQNRDVSMNAAVQSNKLVNQDALINLNRMVDGSSNQITAQLMKFGNQTTIAPTVSAFGQQDLRTPQIVTTGMNFNSPTFPINEAHGRTTPNFPSSQERQAIQFNVQSQTNQLVQPQIQGD